MKNHTKIYLKEMGYTDTDFVPCEISGHKAVDIHHIIGRGKGGQDRIENLMAITRENHIEYGDKKEHMKQLLFIHEAKLSALGVKYDKNWFLEKHRLYEN